MNIVLILPKYSVSIHDPCAWPLGFMSISAVLKQSGHNVKVLNFNLHEYELEDELSGAHAALFTGFEEFRELNIVISEWCRTNGIHTAIGGALATFATDEMVQYFDAVVVGEGEEVIETALHSRGIIQGVKPDIATLPFPDYSGFGIDEYNKRHNMCYMGVLTSRGCPYECKFCAQTCSFQYRDVSDVFKEIDSYIKSYAVTHIVFNDNTINIRKDRFMDICKGMKERGLTWTAAVRADRFDEEMALAAKDSGCSWFVVGVESFNDCKLVEMNKKVTAQQIISTLDLMHKYELGYHGNILLGLPGESYDDIFSELEVMPRGYNVFPVLVQPFIGTGYKGRSITVEQESHLSGVFREYATSKGMTMYREVA